MDEDGKSRSINRRLVFKYYNKEMKNFRKILIKKNKDLKIYLFQTINEKDKLKNMIINLTYFYDQNYIGNKDFMHIPEFEDIIENIKSYPVIIISKKNNNESEEIFGTTTIKFKSKFDNNVNPFFPIKNENLLCITGVLSKLNALDNNCNRICELGKCLFKISIIGAYNLNVEEKVRLICEVDCRNKNSLKSISNAVKELKNDGINVQLYIAGYYEIYNYQNCLIEAPTFILEVDLNENRNIDNSYIDFSYENCEGINLFENISKVIKNSTNELKEYVNFKDNNQIIYHEIKPINALNVKLEVGNSVDGNIRIPKYPNIKLEYAKV